MAHNPYAPPKAAVEAIRPGRAPEDPDLSEELYTSGQFMLAAILGGPMPASWLARSNYKALGQPEAAGRILIWGLLASVVILIISIFLPDKFPGIVLPVFYSLSIRAMAEYKFGAAVKNHRKAGGLIASWWRVVRTAMLGLVALLAMGIVVLSAFDAIGIVTL